MVVGERYEVSDWVLVPLRCNGPHRAEGREGLLLRLRLPVRRLADSRSRRTTNAGVQMNVKEEGGLPHR